MFGPSVDLPFHATLADRDTGECSDLDANNVKIGFLASYLDWIDPAAVHLRLVMSVLFH